MEDSTARQIAKRLIHTSEVEHIAPLMEQIKKEMGVSLSAKQDKAVRMAFRHNLTIITGSPGTGKTTVLKTILEVYRRQHTDGKIMLMGAYRTGKPPNGGKHRLRGG